MGLTDGDKNQGNEATAQLTSGLDGQTISRKFADKKYNSNIVGPYLNIAIIAQPELAHTCLINHIVSGFTPRMLMFDAGSKSGFSSNRKHCNTNGISSKAATEIYYMYKIIYDALAINGVKRLLAKYDTWRVIKWGITVDVTLFIFDILVKFYLYLYLYFYIEIIIINIKYIYRCKLFLNLQ